MRVLATKKSSLMPRVGRSVILDDEGLKVAVFETSDGAIFAVEDYCPQTGGPVLEAVVSSHYIYEPMREYKISLEDGKLQEPDEGQLRTFPVEVVGDEVFIEV